MFRYYLQIASHNLKQNVVLTSLIVLATAIGIGGTMSIFTVFYAMSGNPIPEKSNQLFVPQIDNQGPRVRRAVEPPKQMDYQDAVALMQAHAASRQSAMYRSLLTYSPDDPSRAPQLVSVRAAFSEFFSMFDTPFRLGSAWSAADDKDHANVVVVNATFADGIAHGDAVIGKTINLDGVAYQIVGVLNDWNPAPRFYDLDGGGFGNTESIFLPFTTAIDKKMVPRGNTACSKEATNESAWQHLLETDCNWIQFWVFLPRLRDVADYREFLDRYAAEQRSDGRFDWLPTVRLRSLGEWLSYNDVVPANVRASSVLGFGLLAVCLINAVGLLLAKLVGQLGELSIRRALGATKRDVFFQCLTETSILGFLGGILGLGLCFLGTIAERLIVPIQVARAIHIDVPLIGMTVVLAVASTVCAGLYPAWRATRIQPAWQLKAQ